MPEGFFSHPENANTKEINRWFEQHIVERQQMMGPLVKPGLLAKSQAEKRCLDGDEDSFESCMQDTADTFQRHGEALKASLPESNKWDQKFAEITHGCSTSSFSLGKKPTSSEVLKFANCLTTQAEAAWNAAKPAIQAEIDAKVASGRVWPPQ